MFVFLAAATRARVVTAGFGSGAAKGFRLLCRIVHVEDGFVVRGCAFLCIGRRFGGLLPGEVYAVGFRHGSEQFGHAGGLFFFEFGRGSDLVDDEDGGATEG